MSSSLLRRCALGFHLEQDDVLDHAVTSCEFERSYGARCSLCLTVPALAFKLPAGRTIPAQPVGAAPGHQESAYESLCTEPAYARLPLAESEAFPTRETAGASCLYGFSRRAAHAERME